MDKTKKITHIKILTSLKFSFFLYFSYVEEYYSIADIEVQKKVGKNAKVKDP